MKYYIIAGEASGDLHGSNLIRELNKLDNEAKIRAWGGDKMKEAGADVVKHYKDHNFMGFVEVIVHLQTIISNFRFCKKDILNFKPDVLVLIDFPGFNLRIAKWAKRQNLKIVYYISPQVWAWKSSRAHTIRKVVDRMITILPFEKDFYKTFDIDADYVGHPLLDVLKHEKNNTIEKNTIVLLPGSRTQEIKRMLPVMTSMATKFTDYEFVIAGVKNMNPRVYEKYSTQNIKVEYEKLHELLGKAKAAAVTSGTATLETALSNVPLVVCYKGNYLSYRIAKRLIKVKFISLVNLIADKVLVKELIQHEMNEKNLQTELHRIITDNTYRNAMFEGFRKLREKLGNEGASARAAEIIFNSTHKNCKA